MEEEINVNSSDKSIAVNLIYGFGGFVMFILLVAFTIITKNFEEASIVVTFVLPLASFLIMLALLLTKYKHYGIAKFIIVVIPPYTVLIFSLLAKYNHIIDNVFLYITPRLLTIIYLLVPVLFFGLRHIKAMSISFGLILIPAVFFDVIHNYFGVGLSSMEYTDKFYYLFIALSSVFYSISLLGIIFFQKIGLIFREKLYGKTKELEKDKKSILKLNNSLKFQADLYEILNITSQSKNLVFILQEVLERILATDSLTIEKKGLIFLKNEMGNLDIVADHNVDVLIKTCSVIKPGQCLCGQVLQSKSKLFCNSVGHNHTIIPEGMKPHGHYVIPIMNNEVILGVLNIYVKAGVEKDETIVKYLEAVAGILAKRIEFEKRKEVLKEKNIEIKHKKREIDTILSDLNKSIDYARYLQESLIPNQKTINRFFEDASVLFLPKDVVSGDFYFAHEINDLLYFGVGDCTGHGIPGAFLASMSIEAVKSVVVDNPGTSPDIILSKLRAIATTRFSTNISNERSDSMDAALCMYNRKNHELLFAGGFIDLLIIGANGEIRECKATRCPVGTYLIERDFELHKVKLLPDDTIYIASDGYYDQFGLVEGEEMKPRKYKRKRFHSVIRKIHYLKSEEQVSILKDNFMNWKEDLEQIDDVTVMILKH